MRPLLLALSFACLLLIGEPSGLAQPISFRANQITNLPSTLLDEIGSLVQGDFNGDGKADVVLVATNEILVYPGVGGGLVGAPIVTPISPILNFVTAVAVDFNGDGIEDLVLLQEVYSTNENQIVTMLGNGDGTFRVAVVTSIPFDAAYLETADFNNDGIPDISWISGNSNEVVMEVQLGIGNGAFEAPRSVPLPSRAFGIRDRRLQRRRQDRSSSGRRSLLRSEYYRGSAREWDRELSGTRDGA